MSATEHGISKGPLDNSERPPYVTEPDITDDGLSLSARRAKSETSFHRPCEVIRHRLIKSSSTAYQVVSTAKSGVAISFPQSLLDSGA